MYYNVSWQVKQPLTSVLAVVSIVISPAPVIPAIPACTSTTVASTVLLIVPNPSFFSKRIIFCKYSMSALIKFCPSYLRCEYFSCSLRVFICFSEVVIPAVHLLFHLPVCDVALSSVRFRFASDALFLYHHFPSAIHAVYSALFAGNAYHLFGMVYGNLQFVVIILTGSRFASQCG